MADPKPLSREQLAKFLPDNEAIRRFERLFAVAGDLTPTDVATLFRLSQEASIDAGLANSKAAEAHDSLQRISRSLEVMASTPGFQMPVSFPVDYLDFNTGAPRFATPRRVAWNDTDDTLDIFHTGGVTQQVGLETYMRAANNTGSSIPNGSCVGFAGVSGGNVIDIQKYIADGSLQSLYIIGVLTEDAADTAKARVTVWGNVRGLDTTGTPYGETWIVGDILYASPTTLGGFTNSKPTAPNLALPVAAVLSVDATTGEIFVRPTIEQQKFYGSFLKTTDQSPAAINTAYAITWDSASVSNGVSIGAPASRIVAANAGLYEFTVSYQLTSGSASVKNVWLWFRKNGVDISDTALITSLDSGTAIKAPSRSMFFSLAAGDYIELMFASDSVNVTLDASGATAFSPSSPASILTVTQVQQ